MTVLIFTSGLALGGALGLAVYSLGALKAALS
jgi:hypothetical protein